MRYFVNFKNDRVNCSWERETDQEHPSYIKENIFEVTKEQYDLNRFLTLNEGVVEWEEPKYQAYLDKIDEKEIRKNKIKDKNLNVKDRLDALTEHLGLA